MWSGFNVLSLSVFVKCFLIIPSLYAKVMLYFKYKYDSITCNRNIIDIFKPFNRNCIILSVRVDRLHPRNVSTIDLHSSLLTFYFKPLISLYPGLWWSQNTHLVFCLLYKTPITDYSTIFANLCQIYCNPLTVLVLMSSNEEGGITTPSYKIALR